MGGTPYIVTSYANRKTFVPLLKETNTSGTINGIGITKAKKEHHFRITVDGRQVHEIGSAQQSNQTIQLDPSDNYFAYVKGNSIAHHAFTLNFEFEDSLKVEIRDDQGKYPTTRFWVAYEIEDGSEDSEEGTENGSGNSEMNIDDEDHHVEDGLVYTKRTFDEIPRKQTLLHGDQKISRVNLQKHLCKGRTH